MSSRAGVTKGRLYLAAGGVQQVNAGHVALTARGRLQPRHAADGEKLRTHALALQLAEQVVEADAVAADDDQIPTAAARGRAAGR